MSPLTLARGLALGAPLLLVGGALVSQYAFGLYPCEIPHCQRWPHYFAVPLALAAIALGNRRIGAVALALATVAILVSGFIGVFHAGVEYGWWDGVTTCATTAATGADALAGIMTAPVVRCDQPQWTLAGISLAGFNAIFSGLAALTILGLVTKARHAQTR